MSIAAHDFWVDALCTQTGDDLFFPDRFGDNMQSAKQICAMCSVRERCLESALRLPNRQDEYGVFGGLTPRERHGIRKQRREAA